MSSWYAGDEEGLARVNICRDTNTVLAWHGWDLLICAQYDVHKQLRWMTTKDRAAQGGRTTLGPPSHQQALLGSTASVTVTGPMVSGIPHISLKIVLSGPLKERRCNLTERQCDVVY